MLMRPSPPSRRRAALGVTLVELVVAIALLGLLLGLAAPSFGTWTRNAKVRTVSESLLAGVRLAQSEAVRRNRQVVLFLTTSQQCSNAITASANGAYWAVRTVGLTAGEAVETVQCGALADSAQGVGITGPTTLCFNSMGRQVANADPGVGGSACTLAAAGVSRYDVATTANPALGVDRPLRVLVGLSGQARMCDPARVLSAANTDGCPELP
jgi:type IV fimbrial biogenesis protein FimT